MNVYELIDKIRLRTAMYIGHASPTHLRSFLSGYYLEKRHEIVKEEEPSFAKFNDWIADKFDYYESTSGWAYMIEDQRDDKQEALYLFYELLDEYRGIRHNQIARVKFRHEESTDQSWRGYSRRKKVRGTFEAIPKPLPYEIIIQKMKINNEWFQMVARNKNKEILSIRDSERIENLYKSAERIFGIVKDDWEIK